MYIYVNRWTMKVFSQNNKIPINEKSYFAALMLNT